ncbi:YfiR family protein [Marinilabilia rubra]|uniref:DUF4154 domain-containing protein n=1 Tax=Marinilabilia rubra TaxID=2162893 RepID=A0A2U2B3L6_9BACT|nr:YfiR family protein [Marinilabilia rubra]PWD97655.1 DUF4154 domain-containing protein [Marinilabilia rubra]
MYRRILIITVLLILSVRMFSQEENYISLYMFNFTRYVEWPVEKRSGNFVIEVLGHVSVYEKLKEMVSGKKVGNQPIEVRNYMSVNEMGQPHVMFVGHWKSREMPQVIDKLGGESTLIIGEKEGMIDQGAAINFVIREGKIKFEFKEINARDRGLSVSSRLRQMGIVLE